MDIILKSRIKWQVNEYPHTHVHRKCAPSETGNGIVETGLNRSRDDSNHFGHSRNQHKSTFMQLFFFLCAFFDVVKFMLSHVSCICKHYHILDVRE